MEFSKVDISVDQLKTLYKRMLLPRLVEEKMLVQLRKGKISKWFSGVGQEGVAVGVTSAMEQDEYILPLIRNLGVFTTRGIPLEKLFEQFQGKENGFTRGRDRSFHFGTNNYHIFGMISHLGPQMAVANGIGQACRLSRNGKATLVFTGDGGTSEGDFHEALNVASVWDLPVIFLIENNIYGLSTPINEQYNCEHLADRASGYGMESHIIDGNNVLEVYKTVDSVAQDIRQNPHPVLIECKTFRMRGHEEASGTKYVPDELFEEWGQKDPIDKFEKYLLEEDVLSESTIQSYQDDFKKAIDEGLKEAYAQPVVQPDPQKELNDVYRYHTPAGNENTAITDRHAFLYKPSTDQLQEKRYIDAVSEGLYQGMQQFDNLIVMGQDVAEYGGVFKVTQGFVDKFGKERVCNTPLCESAILGMGLGLSVKGYKSVIEMQFSDFVTMGFNQIVNNLAKVHYRWGQNADVVVRMPAGGGVAAGPFHSQSTEAWFTHTPGLKVVYPATPMDAKGLLTAAIEDPNPVMYYEHKFLYRGATEEVYEDYFTVEIGKARQVQEGHDLSVITYGAGVQWAQEIINEKFGDASIELIDLRSLVPWDKAMVEASIQKTNKALVFHEAVHTGGFGGELASYIAEHCFECLDGPVTRVSSLNTPVPFAPELEEQFLAKNRLEEKLNELLNY